MVPDFGLLRFLFMHILIENDETLEYLTSDRTWTKNPLAGLQFPNKRAAFQAAKLEEIGRFTIVLYLPHNHQFLNLERGRGKGLPDTAIEG